jgi:hypothetical protein
MEGPRVKPFGGGGDGPVGAGAGAGAGGGYPSFLERLIDVLFDKEIQRTRPYQISVNQYLDAATKGTHSRHDTTRHALDGDRIHFLTHFVLVCFVSLRE